MPTDNDYDFFDDHLDTLDASVPREYADYIDFCESRHMRRSTAFQGVML